MANLSGGFFVIRPTDLKDPTCFAINSSLQYLYNKVSVLTQSLTWQKYVPTVSASGSMTATGLTFKVAQYLEQQNSVTLLLNVSVVLGGTMSNAFYITLPMAPLSVTSQYGCGAAMVVPSAAAVAATINNGLIRISQYNNANFTAGTYEVVLSTTYPIS